MLEVSIIGAKFFAYHGVHEEEQKIGNWFTVDATVLIEDQADPSNLDQSIDYGKIYDLVSELMKRPVPLLEQLIDSMEKGLAEYDIIESDLTIKKHNPPLGGQVEYSQVRRKKVY